MAWPLAREASWFIICFTTVAPRWRPSCAGAGSPTGDLRPTLVRRAMAFSTPGVVIGLVLAAGVVMAPIRAFQALGGRLVSHSSAVKAPTGAITTLFLLAFLFWLAVIWAAFNIEIRRSCSGDNCIGYMLLAMPFPFVYGLAEVLLFRARRSSSPGQPPGTSL